MHHIAEPSQVRRTLSEMVRVTRPEDGSWSGTTIPEPLLVAAHAAGAAGHGAERLVPLPELVAGLRNAGADIVRTERLGLMPDFVPRWLLGPAAAVERAVEATPVCGASAPTTWCWPSRRDHAAPVRTLAPQPPPQSPCRRPPAAATAWP